MMMPAEACIIGGAMDGCSHLGIAEREDIMVRWKCHEGASQIARELHRDKPTISRENPLLQKVGLPPGLAPRPYNHHRT